jgi:hypothetical protein
MIPVSQSKAKTLKNRAWWGGRLKTSLWRPDMYGLKWIVALLLIGFLLLVGCQGETKRPSKTPGSVASKSVTASRDYNSLPFEESLMQVQGYSTSVEITWPATGEKTLLSRNDPTYAEFMHLFYMSFNGERLNKVSKIDEYGQMPTLNVPYSWGYVFLFTLRDSSRIWFNAKGENIRYESEDVIYEGGFSEEFRSFLEQLSKTELRDAVISSIIIEPRPGEYLYHKSLLSGGTILRAASVREGILDVDYFDLRDGGSVYKKGEPCLLVTGQVESQIDKYKYMTMVSRGYNADGQKVAHVLDHGPIYGVISIDLPPKGFGGFIIHLNPAPDIVRIELIPSPELYDIQPP